MVAVLILASAFAGWRAWRRLRFFLHRIQLAGYHINEYTGDTLRRREGSTADRSHGTGLVLIGLLAAGTTSTDAHWPAVIAALGWCIVFASSARYHIEHEKKPLRFTPRLKRLAATAGTFALLPLAAAFVFIVSLPLQWSPLVLLSGWLLSDLGAPVWVALGAMAMRPVERRIQSGFKADARNVLATREDLAVVGITGSYGKTSVKFVVDAILKRRYSVLPSPGSYNTPMGVCIVVNHQLRPYHQVLVLEMGARYAGDIKELCEIAAPDIGIVTGVGKAHLETMGPIERIAEVKAEIVRHMKPGGPLLLNADDPRALAMRSEARGKVWRVSAEGNEAEIAAVDISYGPSGSTFVVRDEEGNRFTFRTKLLGRHNVLNILFGVAVGRLFGLRLRQMAHAVRGLDPVPHRLQLRREGELTVIDDAFNANPVGARNAVDILGAFEGTKRIVITPGMVELGTEQERENFGLGAYMASRVDVVILVGPRQTRPIYDGLLSAGFVRDSIHVCKSLSEAQNHLAMIAEPGDVVLYENDLPDQYTER